MPMKVMISSIFRNAISRLVSSLVVGIVAGVLTSLGVSVAFGALVGIALAASVFVIAGSLVLWPLDARATYGDAGREDFRPAVDEVVISSASLCGLGGTVGLLVIGGSDADFLPAVMALVSVFMAWAGLHLTYATRYANMFYNDEDGGIDFSSNEKPAYRDFFYFSYGIGMTSEAPGTPVTSSDIRAVVLRHALLSYVFRAVILAATINVVVGVFQ